ncbi:MAG: sugar transferase [Gammaproteobacteria bacterium]|nr:sugar transferase [Gammaproteobacteria bacterium]
MIISDPLQGLSSSSAMQKRVFDLIFSLLGLFFLWWLILLAALLAWLDTGENGFFTQVRVGQFGKIFKVIKIRTMKPSTVVNTTVTTSNDSRITSLGRFFRRTKVDELPQLINVLIGQMSFVGPRPDVPGFADQLQDEEKVILGIKPGITGPATLAYRNEEEILASVDDPEKYNSEVIFPDKVRINIEYINNYSLIGDVKYIAATIFG